MRVFAAVLAVGLWVAACDERPDPTSDQTPTAGVYKTPEATTPESDNAPISPGNHNTVAGIRENISLAIQLFNANAECIKTGVENEPLDKSRNQIAGEVTSRCVSLEAQAEAAQPPLSGVGTPEQREESNVRGAMREAGLGG